MVIHNLLAIGLMLNNGGGWIATGDPQGFPKTYIDMSTVSREGTKVKVWTLTSHQTTTALRQSLSTKGQLEFDCSEAQFRLLTYFRFSDKMGTGKVMEVDNTSGDWSPIPPDSIVGNYSRLVCS